MALPCYAHNLCLQRSLHNCGHYPHKAILLYNCSYFTKKGLSSNAKDNNTENSSSTNLKDKSQVEPIVEEVLTMKEESKSRGDDLSVLEEPTTCCMSGCANCVWIEYAEELSKRFKDGGEKAREAIMKMSDPNMRAFLLTELKTKVDT